MMKIPRVLATRLRRLVRPARRTLGTRPVVDAWARVDRALSAPVVSAEATRQREWAQENLRLVITLVGQQGHGAITRLLAACDGDAERGGEGVRVALAVASALGRRPSSDG